MYCLSVLQCELSSGINRLQHLVGSVKYIVTEYVVGSLQVSDFDHSP